MPGRLASILAQGPERLFLTLPERYARFPDWDGSLPDLPEGVTVLRGPDHGPATKVIEAARHSDRVIICDDDCDYGAGWLDAFRRAAAEYPDAAIAGSVFDSARLGVQPGGRVVQGFAGVLLQCKWLLPLPPSPLHWVDDIWLSASFAVHRVPVIGIEPARLTLAAHEAPAALQAACFGGRTRAELNAEAVRLFAETYGIWSAPAV
ncbi:MAG: hypothetical protein AAGP08_15290 [Pseudomonadota bacterium]